MGSSFEGVESFQRSEVLPLETLASVREEAQASRYSLLPKDYSGEFHSRLPLLKMLTASNHQSS